MDHKDNLILQKLHQGIFTKTADETIQIAYDLAPLIPEDRILALHGNLGTGKTTFVGGLARAWEIPGPITSPTYNIYTLYDGKRQLVHLDAYRLHSGSDLNALMIDDFLSSPWCLAVEWPERIAEELPVDTWHVYFSIDSDQQHRIQIMCNNQTHN